MPTPEKLILLKTGGS